MNGFTDAILQREELTHFLASNLFWINVGAGVISSSVFAALGPLIALLYHDPMVTHAVEGVSLTILAASGSVILLALMNRAMRFTSIWANGVVARAVCVIVSIVLALVPRHSASHVQEMLLDSRTLSCPYLERKGVEAIVRGRLKGDRNYTTEIHRLLSLELLHRLFVDAR